tara:strand:- start:626 stop:994 length:369 start_codon:yes stop_codon:yes gene_type:complete
MYLNNLYDFNSNNTVDNWTSNKIYNVTKSTIFFASRSNDFLWISSTSGGSTILKIDFSGNIIETYNIAGADGIINTALNISNDDRYLLLSTPMVVYDTLTREIINIPELNGTERASSGVFKK